jgi:hypothetical protein
VVLQAGDQSIFVLRDPDSASMGATIYIALYLSTHCSVATKRTAPD